MKVLGANPLMVDAPAFPIARGLMLFPRKSFAAAGYVNNASAPELVTVTYQKSVVWRSPETTTSILSMSGWGGGGTAASSSPAWYYSRQEIAYSNGTTSTEYDFTYNEGYAPADSCSYYEGSNTTVTIVRSCTFYTQIYPTYTDGEYGGDTTAFGKTFVGGYGNGITIQNVTEPTFILPNTDYPIEIPSGGMLSFSFYK